MLSESLQELLSAYVDGELVPAEYERVMAALRDSAVARDYVKQLREISAQIKGMPRLSVPTSFSTHYLKHSKQVRRRQKAWRWGAVGAAAAALIAGVSIWLNQPQPVNPLPGPGGREVAVNDGVPSGKLNLPAPVTPQPKQAVDATWLADLGRQAASWSLDQMNRIGADMDRSLTGLQSALVASEKREKDIQERLSAYRLKIVGNPYTSVETEAATSLTVNPEDFNLAALEARWNRKGLYAADLTCTDTIKALTRLNDACKKSGITLVLDEDVRQRLEKRLPATFVIYLENVKEEALKNVWASLGDMDHWHDAIYRVDASCQSISFAPLKDDEETRKQLARSLGLDPQKLSAPKGPTTPALQQAVVVGYFPNRTSAVSQNVKAALHAQSGPQPDAVSIVFKLRSGK